MGGAYGNGNQSLDGYIDDLRVWHQVLDADDIAALYGSADPLYESNNPDYVETTKVVEYTYDAFDRRTVKWIDDNGDGDLLDAGDEVHQYVYDGEDIVLAFDKDADLTNRYLHGPAVDQIFADEQYGADSSHDEPDAEAGVVYWPLTDNLGSVRQLVGNDGEEAARLEYDSFGQMTAVPGAGTVDHIFGYTGREHDAESHLQYNRARYYDAALGRWISEDPIGFAAGDANLSRYVGNGPTNATDPSGLITWGDFFGGVLDVAAGAAEGANQIIKAKDNPFVAADLALGLYQRGKESVEIGVQAGEMINDVHDDLPKAIIEGTLVGTAHAAGLADSYYSYEGEELCLNDGKLDSRKLTDRERVAGGINGAIAWSGLAGSIWRLPSWFRPRGLKPKPGWRSCFVAGTRVVIAMQHNDLAETDDSATPPKWYACVIAGVFGLTALGFERRRQRSEDERVGDKQKPARARRRVGEAGKQSAHPRRQDAHSDKPTGDRSGREAVFAAPSDESHALDAASTCLTQPKPIGNRPGHRHRHRTGVGLLVASLFAICCLGWFLTGSADKAPSDVRHRASSGRSHTTRAIESIRVGERVVGDAIRGDGENEFGDVDPATWRKLSLRAPRADGTVSHVELLRPVWWLAERGAAVGKTVHLDVRECSILGDAEVLSIAPCPPLAEGNGRVVTGTFRHPAAAIIDVHVDGLTAPIGTTPNHRFWSEDRQDYVAAGELQPGERVRTLAGLSRVDRIASREEPEDVYNLEIHVDHVYHVGTSGVLVHNVGDCPPANGTLDNPVPLDPKPKSLKPDLTDAKARTHILDGDGPDKGGGHRHGTGKPGKSEFPKDWSDEKILGEVSDIATDPSVKWSAPAANGYATATKTIDGVDVKVVYDTHKSRIVTAYPTNTPRNP